MNAQHALFQKLGRELFQTETSAVVHSRREADRLPETPVAMALLRVANHAEASLAQLPPSFGENPSLRIGMSAGRLFSSVRQLVTDQLIDRERSYRGTLLGMHHGIDLVRLLMPIAAEVGDHELADWCGRWLETRTDLVEEATQQLDWFVRNPKEACERGTRPLAPIPAR